ncbi:MAG: hypothetical protein OEL80_07060 [Desulfuromonadales bacterium]|nr:hypothetical protein [Desulfuromonadales bacterium]
MPIVNVVELPSGKGTVSGSDRLLSVQPLVLAVEVLKKERHGVPRITILSLIQLFKETGRLVDQAVV